MVKPIAVQLFEQDGELKLSFDTPGRTGHIDAQEISRLIQALLQLRAQMEPQVPWDFPTLQRIPTEIDPRWFLWRDPMSEQPSLAIRDPGLGWRAYRLPTESATRLQEVLGDVLSEDPPSGPMN